MSLPHCRVQIEQPFILHIAFAANRDIYRVENCLPSMYSLITSSYIHNRIPSGFVDKCQVKALNLVHYPAVHRCFPPRCTGALPRHAARGRSVHFPGGVQVHVHRPIGGDRHRFGGLRRRYASSPREPSPIRHAGGTLCLKTMRENPNKTAVVGASILYCTTIIRPRGPRLNCSDRNAHSAAVGSYVRSETRC